MSENWDIHFLENSVPPQFLFFCFFEGFGFPFGGQIMNRFLTNLYHRLATFIVEKPHDSSVTALKYRTVVPLHKIG